MKKLITLTLFCFLFLPSAFIGVLNAQNATNKTFKNSFVIHGNLSTQKIIFYTKCIESADMEQFRLKNQTVTLKFKNNFLLELVSAKELALKNTNGLINLNNYNDKAPSINYKYPLFEILDSGALTAEIQNTTK